MSPEEQKKVLRRIQSSLAESGSEVRILVIEDDPNDAILTMSKLREFGLDPILAQTTIEIEETIKQMNPWLIFLDLKLHNLAGLDVLKTVRRVRPDIHVVVLTGAYTLDSEECAEALTLDAVVISKPLSDSHAQLLFGTPPQ